MGQAKYKINIISKILIHNIRIFFTVLLSPESPTIHLPASPIEIKKSIMYTILNQVFVLNSGIPPTDGVSILSNIALWFLPI